MLKAGDKVKFLNAVGGGTVTGFVSPTMVRVEDEQGFEVPVLISELVKDERYAKIPGLPEKEVPVIGRPAPRPAKDWMPLFASSAGKPATETPAFFLAFVPEVPTRPLSGEIRAWLVNDSPYTVLFHFSLCVAEEYLSEKSGRIPAFSRIPLKGFTHADFSDFPGFGIQILPFERKSTGLHNALVKRLRVNPVKFYKETSFTENAYFEQRAILISLKESGLTKDLEKLKNHDFGTHQPSEVKEPEIKSASRKKEPADLREVDLHIHELVEHPQGLEPKDLLDIQMNRFRSEMESAIREGIRRIVFIHGIGQGTLKNELRKELSSKYRKYDFQDASFREYGYGATMVILK